MIEYKDNLEGISPDDLTGFFEGWDKKPGKEKHYRILNESDYMLLALNENKVIGFVNAITDNNLSAYIPLLEVLPEYRGKGIGRELIKRMLGKLGNFYMVDLCCDENLSGFYQKLGMNKVSGMILRNYDRI